MIKSAQTNEDTVTVSDLSSRRHASWRV